MSAPTLATSTVFSRRLVIGNAAALVLAYAVPRALTFAAAVVAARFLGAREFGLYTTAATAAVVASIVATAGMQPLLVREVARDPARAPELIGHAHAAKAVMILLMVVAIALTPALGYSPTVVGAAAILAISYAIGAFVENLAAYFQGIEHMHVWTQASALFGIVSGALGVVLVLVTRSVLWLCIAPAIGQTASFAHLLRRAPPAIRRPPRPRAAEVAALLRGLVPFAVTFVATTIYYRADVLILAGLRAPTEVGIYGAAGRFLDVSQALALAGAGALLPHFARNRASRDSGTLRLLGLFALLGILASTALFVFRDILVTGLYGEAYTAAIPLVALLAPVVAARGINMFALSACAGADLMRPAGALFGLAAIVSVALNVPAIRAYGATGAAMVSLVTEILLALALTALLWRRIER